MNGKTRSNIMTEKKKISLNIVQPKTEEPKTRVEGGDIVSEISAEIANNQIVLYMKGTPAEPRCGFSARASQILGSFGLAYHTVDILADPEKRQAIKQFSNWPTIPQVYIGGEFLGGSDILTQMYENGQLDTVIKAL